MWQKSAGVLSRAYSGNVPRDKIFRILDIHDDSQLILEKMR